MGVDSLQTLQRYFGFDAFRPYQQEAVEAVLGGKDVFVLMPTGGGKSLCYVVPSVMMGGVTVVVSPLISLMKDQVDNLGQNGIAAAFLNSSLSESQQTRVIGQVKDGALRLLYVAPERLVQLQFRQWLKQLSINFFAIDEAHCISQWGHDFRPEYRQLALLRQEFPTTPIMALTATATERVKKDIVQQLRLQQQLTLVASFFRSNLYYAVEPKQEVKTAITEFVNQRTNQSGIVYCQSRAMVERLADHLQSKGIRASTYHAGLNDEDRQVHQELFRRDEVQVMVATVAFGMGIDKPNVRFVLHESVPRSLEHYYQETGRAGRDGLPSECVMYFSSGDLQLYRTQASASLPEEERAAANTKIDQIQRFAMSATCRHHQLLSYFNEQHLEQNCGACDNCIHPRAMFDATELSQKILSCVYRLPKPFAPTYITAILTGEADERIKRSGHDQLSVFGVIKDYPSAQLRQIMLELASRGCLTIDADNYNAVSLTPLSISVLKGRQKIELSDLFLPRAKKVKPLSVAGQKGLVGYNQADVDMELFELLRSVRKKLSAEAGIPPYIVFADTSLTDMAIQKPTTLQAFELIYGVGQQKLERYGQPFVEVIAQHMRR
jgi:ATP-dependent DNA helicase RecQ